MRRLDLPEFCAGCAPVNNEVILIQNGEMGCYRGEKAARLINDLLNVATEFSPQRLYEIFRSSNVSCINQQVLPAYCVAIIPESQKLVFLAMEEKQLHEGEDAVTIINGFLNVSDQESAAMLAASFFGWTTPAANPANYHWDGTFSRSIGMKRKTPYLRVVK